MSQLAELEGINGFIVTLERFKEEIFDVTIGVKKKVAFGIYRRAVKRSPVDTGYFRLGWNLSIGSPDRSTPAEGAENYPAPNMAGAFSRIANVGVDDDILICNAVSYAVYLEAGSSDQAPEGILALSILEELAAFRSTSGFGQTFSGGLTINKFEGSV